MIANEERAKDEEQSYYRAIGKVIHLHEQLIEFGSVYENEAEEVKAAMMQQEEEEQPAVEGQNRLESELTENFHILNGGESGKIVD